MATRRAPAAGIRVSLRRRRRGLVLTALLLALGAGAALNLRLLLDPQEVRRRARTALETIFSGPVTIDSAEVSLPNVVVLRGVRVARAGDPDRPVLVVPRVRVGFSLVGGLVGGRNPRRLTIEEPRLEVERRADGTLDLGDLLRPAEDGGMGGTAAEVLISEGHLVYRDAAILRPGRAFEVTGLTLLRRRDGSVSGHGAVEGVGRLSFEIAEGGRAVDARLAGIRLESPLERLLAEEPASRIAGLRPEGPATLAVRARLRDGAWSATLRLSLLGDRIAADRPEGPALLLENLRGDVVLEDGRLRFEDVVARAASGEVVVSGSVGGPDAGAVGLRVRGRDVIIGRDDVRPLLPAEIRRVVDAYEPWFLGDLDLRLVRAGPDSPLRPDLTYAIRWGRMRYHGYPDPVTRSLTGFPLLLQDITGRLRYREDRLAIAEAHGRHADAPVRATGEVYLRTLQECDVDVSIVGRDVPVDDDLRRAFGVRAPFLLDPVRPEGRAGRVLVRVVQDVNGPPSSARVGVTVDLDGRFAMRPRDFPLRVERLRGRLSVGPDPDLGPDFERANVEDLRGEGPGRSRVSLGGWIVEWGRPEESRLLTIGIDDLPLDEALDSALEASGLDADAKETWRALRPRGLADAMVRLVESPAGQSLRLELRARGVRLDTLPGLRYPVDEVRGLLRIVEGVPSVSWASGRAGTGRFLVRGGPEERDGRRLSLRVDDLPVDPALVGALREKLAAPGDVWERLGSTTGRVDLEVEAATGGTDAGIRRVTISDPLLRMVPPEGVPVEVRAGRAEADLPDGPVRLTGVRGKLGEAGFQLEVETGPGGTDPVLTLSTDPLRPAAELRGLLPEELLAGLADALDGGRIGADELRIGLTDGAIRLGGGRLVVLRDESAEGLAPEGALRVERLEVRPPEGGATAFEGQVEIEETGLRTGLAIEGLSGRVVFRGRSGGDLALVGRAEDLVGRIDGRRLTQGTAGIKLSEGMLRLAEIAGRLEGGEVRGDVAVRVGPSAAPFVLGVDVRLTGAKLDQFLRTEGGGPASSVGGDLDAEVHLRQKGQGLENLRGDGSLHIRRAELWEIPLFSAILRVLTVVPPIEYRPVFDSADVAFDLRGDRVRIRELEFRSDLLALERGRGTISLFGDVDLTLIPKVRTIDIPGLSDLWSLIKGGLLYRVKVEGTLDRPRAMLEPLPFLHGDGSDSPRVVPEFLGRIRPARGLGM